MTVMRKPANLPQRHPDRSSQVSQDRTSPDSGGSAGGRLGVWAALAGLTGVGVAVALRRSRAKADAVAEAADRGAAVPGGDQLAASFKQTEYAREHAEPAAHVSMTDDEFAYDRHGATVLGSAHPAPGAGHARPGQPPPPAASPDEEPGRAGMA